jgi:agmatinase
MTDRRLMPADWQRGAPFGTSPASPYTFMRIPATRDLSQADVAIVGLPLDIGTVHRPGARYGPLAIRNASMHLLPHGLDESFLFPPFNLLRVVDYGDIETYPGYIEPSLKRFEEALVPVFESGVTPICLGGDHSVSLAVLRAAAEKHGTMSLVHFDAHPDIWPPNADRPYDHSTNFSIAAQEELIDPAASVQIGIRGSLSATIFDLGLDRAAGFHIITADEFARQGCDATVEAIHRIARRLVYVSLDIDCVDPAYAPGTGTPEVAGLTSREIVELVRGLRGLPIIGCDLVEVSPPYDSSEITALLAANLVREFLMLLAAPEPRTA